MKAGNKGGSSAAGSTECVKVTVRCRPMNKKELNEGTFLTKFLDFYQFSLSLI